MRRRSVKVVGAVVALLVVVGFLWWWTGVRSGGEVLMTEVGRTTCVPVHDTEEIVYGEALANVSDEPVEVIGAHFDSTGGAELERAWLAEPGHAVGVLSHWPPPDMKQEFDDGEVVPFPTQLRPNPRRTAWDAQTLVLFIRMPAGSTISHVSVTYRKEGSDTVYQSDATSSTLRAVGAPSCS